MGAARAWNPQRQPLAAFDRVIGPTLGLCCWLLLFCLMAITCADVIGRYFFGTPVYGAFEMTEMLLAALIFVGLPLVTLRNEHITVDLLDPVAPDWLLRIQHVVVVPDRRVAHRLSRMAALASRRHMDSAGETTAQLKFKLAYLTYGMSVLMALTALALLVLAFRRPSATSASQV